MSRRLVIEADGGSRGNPGPAGYGALVRDAATGKVLEVPVKRILSGEPADQALSRDSLADPDALRPFEELAATTDWRNG